MASLVSLLNCVSVCVSVCTHTAMVLPKAEELLRSNVEPYIGSILEALMDPTSRGFAEVRDVFFRETVDMSQNVVNDDSREKLVEVRVMFLDSSSRTVDVPRDSPASVCGVLVWA